MIFFPVIPYI